MKIFLSVCIISTAVGMMILSDGLVDRKSWVRYMLAHLMCDAFLAACSGASLYWLRGNTSDAVFYGCATGMALGMGVSLATTAGCSYLLRQHIRKQNGTV